MNHEVATSKHEKQTNCCIALYSGQFIGDHSFTKRLEKSDREYLVRSVRKGVGEAGQCSWFVLPSSPSSSVCVLGLGKKEDWTARKLVLAARKLFSHLKGNDTRSITLSLDDFRPRTLSLERTAEVVATNLEMAQYEFNRFKEKPKDGWFEVQSISYEVKDASKKKSISKALFTGKSIGVHVNAARELANTPGGTMTPVLLAREAKNRGEKCGVKVTVLNEAEMKKLGMHAILAVSKGSSEEAQFIIMEYLKGPKSQKPIVFVGKGITFDSGGLHLKPGNAMDDMHLDMSGGAATIGALCAIAELGLKTNVIGLIAAVENMPSGESYRPGDILTSMSGKTIEVVSPDAEGRVTLADALWYARRYNPRLVVDVATLTGACIIALGHHASALFSPQDQTAAMLSKAGEECGDYLWRMPLWEEYECGLKGVFGDVLNAPKNREAGSINAALFLYQWAKDFPAWAHIDIASTMTSASDDNLAKGSTGSATRLFIEVARTF
ncbi:MAG: leucyl aminopeptidase [Patescibacteria group bacterium]